MEFAISVVTNELVTRFISFPTNRYSCHACSDEKRLERMQQLLLRVRTIVEEADGRYIANYGMLAQLKMLADAMYRGYWAMGAFKYRAIKETLMVDEEEEVSSSSRLKRSRIFHGNSRKRKARHLTEFHGALESLEIVVANIKEFVVILSGCDRMVRRPYDTYLYIDNFVFGRHSEKQSCASSCKTALLLPCRPFFQSLAVLQWGRKLWLRMYARMRGYAHTSLQLCA